MIFEQVDERNGILLAYKFDFGVPVTFGTVTDEIPDTFEGLTGQPPELAFWNNNLWFLSEVIDYPQSYTHYYWLRIATSDDP